MKHLKVMLEYFYPWTNSAGFYYAREKGWYKEVGLDVEFTLYDPERGDTLAYLARGEADFGIFPSNRLLVQREKQPVVVGVAAINHRGMETVQTVRATGITRPADLSGKRVAMNPTPRGLAMIRQLVSVDGGDPDTIIVVDSGSRELTPDAIAAGEADATFGSYWAWEILMDTEVPEEERIVWPVDEIGAPPYHSYLLGTQEEATRRDPEAVRAFLAATEKGYRALAVDPLLAVPIYERIIPYFPTSLVERSLPLIASTWLHDGAWGVQRTELLEPYAEWLANHGIVHDRNGWKTAYTNSFLSQEG
ncbi:myristoyl transferase [Paenibacillus baekrokdamisoli]|uniref:Thiamine pyrimidine synthase n=1 Tax=Paenibacillus baekrokdamisoli TaxID=1712516 RepID=A0A3G9JJS6_9BACL|nr:ABC transporter substrate-binding protein [Paenibacillus baekrokdamisoli]MBB3073291.1 NitT/TauT family transport system substrate-binding protein [Paenibacillus baekrokdamisoli]BBH23279.1 myristoyl transferase [Paenibacillus baekrokdamisoli]